MQAKFKSLCLIIFIMAVTVNVSMANPEVSVADLQQNHGYIYRLIRLFFGDFIGDYGGGEDNAGTMYTVFTTLGFWSAIAGMAVAVLLIGSAVLNVYKIAEKPKEHMANNAVLFAKILMVMVLITPFGSGGTTAAQRVGVIKVALMGDAFANLMYRNTIRKMLTPPELMTSSVNATQLASQLIRAETCAIAVQANSEQRTTELKDIFKDGKIKPVYSDSTIVITKNSYGRELNSYKEINIGSGDLDNISSIIFAPSLTSATVQNGKQVISTSDVCGSIHFPTQKDGNSVFDKVSQKQSQELKKAVIELANNLAPASQVIYTLSANQIKMKSNADQESTKASNAAISIYNNAVQSYINKVKAIPATINTNVLNNSALTNFIEDAGWGLGVVWWKMLSDTQYSFMQNTVNFADSVSPKILPMCNEQSAFSWWDNKYCVARSSYDYVSSNLDEITMINGANVAGNPETSGTDPQAQFDQICSKTGCSFGAVDSMLGGWMKDALSEYTHSEIFNKALEDNSFKDVTDFKNQQSIFNVSSELGVNLTYMSSFIWTISLGTSVIAGFLDGASDSYLGKLGFGVLLSGGSSLLTWVSSHLDSWAAMLAAPAYTLLVIVPFIPLLIWGMLLLSYMIMLAEAFIAICPGMAMWLVQDDAFISSRVIRTVMMLTALFLRPFLFVVGLIVAYSLAPIALTIWNTLFFWGSTYMNSGSFMTSWFLILVYTAGIIKFTLLCYNVSFVLPDKVLQWLGSGFGDVAAFGSPADFAGGGHLSGSSGVGGGGSTGAAHKFGKQSQGHHDRIKKENEKNKPKLNDSVGGQDQVVTYDNLNHTN
ncbi:MAG: conjugal transfer/type IV secretion protein DotA/TraY [Francisellaceae bacterium]|jgi:conjugal transfer/type IV secretion protein DotA/TraY